MMAAFLALTLRRGDSRAPEVACVIKADRVCAIYGEDGFFISLKLKEETCRLR